MVDIATTLSRLADAIIKLATPHQNHLLEPFTITPSTTITNVMKDQAGTYGQIKVSVIGFAVRSMGTATYVRIGKQGNCIDTLSANFIYTEYQAPEGGWLDASEFQMISDTADAVIEVTGIRVD
ncbi:MAG: hypothetical protein FIB08_04165 [Candidatus Methanoperedens sp.]|nr:hypothetical protein [Candidatus Methanoperedens sp.]